MSDEIYVNTGGTFQQPFNDRQPSNAQQPYIANGQQPYIANAQQPFTYQNRQPAIYQNPTNAQQPYIANAQAPYPYIANSQTPYIANAQQPYPYIANGQNPYQASARQPFTYRNPVNAQQPYIANARQPNTYQNRQPSSSQTPYQANARQPFTYQARATANARQPSNGQSPFTYQNRQPSTYQHPFTYNNTTPASAQVPVIYDVFGGAQTPSTNIETTTDVSGPMAPFMGPAFNHSTVGMSSSNWWGSNSPQMKNNPAPYFSPSNPNSPSNPLYAGSGLANYRWDTSQVQNFQYSHGQCWAYFELGFYTSDSATHPNGHIRMSYAGGNSTAMATVYGLSNGRIALPLTQFNSNGIVDDTWSIDVKYTVQSQSASGGTSETRHPGTSYLYSTTYTAGTYYNIYSGSTSAGALNGTAHSGRQFMWMATSASNIHQQSAVTAASGLIFTIRASKSGQTTYYTHFLVEQSSGAIDAGLHPAGSSIYLRSVYGQQTAK
jgi:hypothetical protein